MKPKLMNFRERDHNSTINKATYHIKGAQIVIDAVNSINSFRVGEEHILDLLCGKGEATAQGIENAVISELAAAKIQSESIVKAAIKGDLEAYYKVFNIRSVMHPESLSLISLKDGTLVLDAEKVESAKEDYCSYIKTERGLDMEAKYKAFISAANEFFDECKLYPGNGMGISNFYSTNGKKIVERKDLAFDKL